MEITLIKLALERLNQELQEMKLIVSQQQVIINEMQQDKITQSLLPPKPKEDEFINMSEVQKILGVCYNSLQKIIQKGLLTPIRINQRRIRFSKAEVLKYLQVGG